MALRRGEFSSHSITFQVEWLIADPPVPLASCDGAVLESGAGLEFRANCLGVKFSSHLKGSPQGHTPLSSACRHAENSVPPRHKMRRGNRVVKPRSAPGAERCPARAAFLPFSLLRSHPRNPWHAAVMWPPISGRQGPAPPSGAEGLGWGWGQRSRRGNWAAFLYLLWQWHSVGPSLGWGAEMQGRRWMQARERSGGLWLPWKHERSSKGADRCAVEGRSHTHWMLKPSGAQAFCPRPAPGWRPFTGMPLSLQLRSPTARDPGGAESRGQQSRVSWTRGCGKTNCAAVSWPSISTGRSPGPARLHPQDTPAVCWAGRCPGRRNRHRVRSLARSAPGPRGEGFSLPSLSPPPPRGESSDHLESTPGYPQLWPDAEILVYLQVCCQKEEPRSEYWAKSLKGLPAITCPPFSRPHKLPVEAHGQEPSLGKLHQGVGPSAGWNAWVPQGGSCPAAPATTGGCVQRERKSETKWQGLPCAAGDKRRNIPKAHFIRDHGAQSVCTFVPAQARAPSAQGARLLPGKPGREQTASVDWAVCLPCLPGTASLFWRSQPRRTILLFPVHYFLWNLESREHCSLPSS